MFLTAVVVEEFVYAWWCVCVAVGGDAEEDKYYYFLITHELHSELYVAVQKCTF